MVYNCFVQPLYSKVLWYLYAYDVGLWHHLHTSAKVLSNW